MPEQALEAQGAAAPGARRKMGIDDLTVRCAPALFGVYSWKPDW